MASAVVTSEAAGTSRVATSRVTGRDIEHALRRAGVAEVDTSALARSLYSSDASLYRVPPRAVVRPRHADELLATLAACRDLGVPLTARGAGTSIAGNAVGPGVVVDTSRFLNRVVSVDAEARTAVVEPGTVHAALQARALPLGLRFGPDPSTHSRCTIGGMIGNNACGARALGYGRTSDNVVALDVVTGTGRRLRLASAAGGGPPQVTALDGGAAELLDPLHALVSAGLATIRTELGRFGRQVSGYALEHLLPEHGFDVARALVGSEGTLALVLGATVRLVPDPAHRALAVLGYAGLADAADAVPALLAHHPIAVEGMDHRVLDRVAGRGEGTPPMPRGGGWLMVEVVGGTAEEAEQRAREVVRDAGALDALVASDPGQAARLWRIREDGAGLTSRTADDRPAYSGWEDAAVPPDRLGAYLRDFDALLAQYHLDGVPYGHLGEGCVHVRIDFPFDGDHDAGRRAFRGFLTDAARLVARYGGSLSGEHGDGRVRSELLPLMYSADAMRLFGQVKELFDPDGVLNPGVLVQPQPIDADLRPMRERPVRDGLGRAFPHDRGDISGAAHRCIGLGKCRADGTGTGQFMCPSYLATREEKDTTRGRARVLQEVLDGGRRPPDWRAPELHAALDLCLSCQACASDCPTGVDMAAMKSEVLFQAYRGRPRPRSHYVLGRLPVWADLAARAPGLTRAAMGTALGGGLARFAAGVDPRRELPVFAPQTFRQWWATEPPASQGAAGGARAALFVDTFTDHFSPEVGRAAVQVLRNAGYAVEVVTDDVCCGLTWISTGQLDTARRRLARTVLALAPLARAGVPVVGLEPSCTAVLRREVLDLVPGPKAEQVARGVRTLAEVLAATPGWQPPDLSGTAAVAQPHCHQHATMGWDADRRLLESAGVALTSVAGCCGLAGNWGAERGHYDVSVAIAEHALLPAVRAAGEDDLLLADGFSCRTQVAQLAGRRAVHLAQALASRAPSPHR